MARIAAMATRISVLTGLLEAKREFPLAFSGSFFVHHAETDRATSVAESMTIPGGVRDLSQTLYWISWHRPAYVLAER
jgi:hypothetical protein